MGRHKMNVVPNTTAKILTDQKGEPHMVVIEENTYYTFTNVRPGPMFFIRANGKEDMFEGHETKTNINQDDREILLRSKDYEFGWLVEEGVEEVKSNNAYSDSMIDKLIEKNKETPKEIEKIIDRMTDQFAVQRFKDACIKANLPASIILKCDYKLQVIEEEYLESKKAPIDTLPEKVIQ